MFDVLLLMLLHCIVTAAYFILNQPRVRKIQNACETGLVFFIPVFGLVILWLIRLLRRFFQPAPHLSSKKLEHQRSIFADMMRYDEDVIPLSDANLLDNREQKRQLFTEAIKRGVLQNHEILKGAIRDEDREVSHYAVSMVTTKIEQLEMRLFELEEHLKQESAEKYMDNLRAYIRTLEEYLSLDFLDMATKRKRVREYCAALQELLDASPLEEHAYVERIRYEIWLGLYDEALKTCAAFQKAFPNAEEAYLRFIEVYAKLKDREKLQAKLDELKKSPLKLTIQALQVIRFWDGRESDV